MQRRYNVLKRGALFEHATNIQTECTPSAYRNGARGFSTGRKAQQEREKEMNRTKATCASANKGRNSLPVHKINKCLCFIAND